MEYLPNTKVLSRLSCLFIIILFFNCSNSQKDQSIVPLLILNKTDTTEAGNEIVISNEHSSPSKDGQILHRTEYFLVKNYSQEQKNKAIEKFTTKYKNSEFKTYDSYEMIFVKESKDINEKIINSNPEILNTSGFGVHKNIVFVYDWEKGVYKGMLQFEDGKIRKADKK